MPLTERQMFVACHPFSVTKQDLYDLMMAIALDETLQYDFGDKRYFVLQIIEQAASKFRVPIPEKFKRLLREVALEVGGKAARIQNQGFTPT